MTKPDLHAMAMWRHMLARPAPGCYPHRETLPIYIMAGYAVCNALFANLPVWTQMMSDTFDMTTLVFAALAIFVLWKLWSVLGARTGSERPPHNPFAPPKPKVDGENVSLASNVVRLPGTSAIPVQNDNDIDRWKGLAEQGSAVWLGLDAIANADKSFAASAFMEGAKKAYEMIVAAFATGDRKMLQTLLSKEVFDSFSSAIADRESKGEKVETTFVSLDKTVIDEAHFKSPMAQVTVRFFSKLITVTRSREGEIIEGSSDKIVEMNDIWTFARDTASRDPNWKLIATETGH